jgi:hypothetical protein
MSCVSFVGECSVSEALASLAGRLLPFFFAVVGLILGLLSDWGGDLRVGFGLAAAAVEFSIVFGSRFTASSLTLARPKASKLARVIRRARGSGTS